MDTDVGQQQQQQEQVYQGGRVVQQQRPQQLYMSPQTENLNYMYSLVGKLTKELKRNSQKRSGLLWDVDVLAKELGRKFKNTEVKGQDDLDVVIFQKFLNDRENLLEEDDSDKNLDGDCNGDSRRCDVGQDSLTILKRQNEKLKNIFVSKTRLNGDTLSLLYYHEDALNEIVRHLRSDVLQSQEVFIEKVREKFNNEMIPREDTEFKVYLENVEEIQRLMDFSEAYRLLLRLCDS